MVMTHFAISLNQPRMIGSGLKDNLTASSATSFQVDEGFDFTRPFMLSDETMACLELKRFMLVTKGFPSHPSVRSSFLTRDESILSHQSWI